MSDISHFKGISVVDGTIKADISFDRFSKQFQEAQDWLGHQVLEDCKPVMPLKSGTLQQKASVEQGGRYVVFPGPESRFLHMGKVMVDPDTGSPWAKPGAIKVLTDRDLIYGRPEATSHWFDEAKARNGEYWIKRVKEIGGGG